MVVETSLAPEKVRQALLDFSERRPEIWPGIEPSLYEIYSVGETSAEIKEGSKMPGKRIWARERYDWSDPRTVRWTVEESNFSSVGSYVAATILPRDGGGSRIHIEWNRTGSSSFGRFAVKVIVWTKGKPVASSVEKALRRMEAAGS